MNAYQKGQKMIEKIYAKSIRERNAKGYRENLGYDQVPKFSSYLSGLDLSYVDQCRLNREFMDMCNKI
jgi:hypothetical protein